MAWKDVNDEERSAILETDRYEILLNQQYKTEEPQGYLLYSVEKKGLLNNEGKVVCGLGMFSSGGAPSEVVFSTIEEAQTVLE